MNPCCNDDRKILITGGRYSGTHGSGRERVTVCANCGQFDVFVEKDGAHFSLNFKLRSSAELIAASQSYRDLKTDKPVEHKRVWKPLDFGHLRLYEVKLWWEIKQEFVDHHNPKSGVESYVVAGTAPAEAAERIKKIYQESYDNNPHIAFWHVKGSALNVCQPQIWLDNGISLLNNEMIDAIEKHLDVCFGCELCTATDEGMAPCDGCDKLEGFVLARHNREVEDAREEAKTGK